MYRLSLISFLFISFVNSNELTFNEVIEKDDKSVEISFLLEKVSLVKSYSLNNPSRLVLDIYDTKLKEDINISYNYPIKKIRSISEGDTSRIVIDLYENIFWEKPTQVQTKNGVMLTLVTKRIKNLENSIRDIVIAIDAGHGGKYPGAVGPNNILEKDVTLLIAKELERTLRDTCGYYPVMIRSNDETIDLNSRYQEAIKKVRTHLSQFMLTVLGLNLLKEHLFSYGLMKRLALLQEIYLKNKENEYKPILKI